eukprot:CAMPEP_0119132932 /NCGR_PEP_ID=MMETSP1310-20130426/12642_1 /TAXON_ID=464262 /ORGANISM="Genus nov. species nov., Strain RCC2339" /LENGTH=303 /DNA_ID=CAMNT_0007123601 /DNA_START=16 /DNA_END=924 /DNA_ORIENTATION=-
MAARGQTTMRRAGTKKVAKKAAPKKAASGTKAVGYRKFEGRGLWLPDIDPPSWLDGSMVGDRGFDPLGLGKPVEYVQMDIDGLDQNNAVNKAGRVVGTLKPDIDEVSTDSFQPYSEVFGIERFRECELIHGRWCMLATLGVVVAEAATGVSWVDAGKVELAQTQYFNLDLPFTVGQVSWIEAALMLGVEVLRNTELDTEKRCYPGGAFDPLNLAADDERARSLKEAEIKHGRLAMVAFFGFGTQALATGEGALGSLSKFAESFNGNERRRGAARRAAVGAGGGRNRREAAPPFCIRKRMVLVS